MNPRMNCIRWAVEQRLELLPSNCVPDVRKVGNEEKQI
jgi:hypothetical protein